MKQILLLAFAPLLFSCNATQAPQSQTVTRKIDPILHAIVDKYPNYRTNGVTRDGASEALENALDSALNRGILDDLPMKIFTMGKAPDGKGAIIYFTREMPWTEDAATPSNMVAFDLIGFMPEQESQRLDEKGTYYVHGHNYKRLTHDELMRLVSIGNHTPYVGLMKNSGGAYEFLLGTISADIDSVTVAPVSANL